MKRTLTLIICMLLLPWTAHGTGYRIEEVFKDHFFLQDMQRGSCRVLAGDVTPYILFAETAPWDDASIAEAKKTLTQAFAYLEENAALYEKQLEITPAYYIAPSLPPVDHENRRAWLDAALEKAGLPRTGDKGEDCLYCAGESPIIVIYNEDGRSFSVSDGSDNEDEYLFLYQGFKQSSVIHELMHLFGARDFYYPDDYKSAADRYYPETVMRDYECSTIDSLTAYCIGWTDTLDENARNFLYDTWEIDQETFNRALSQASFTGYTSREYDDYTYTGDWVMGEKQGNGVMEWDNGTCYTGEFERDKRQGLGTMIYAGGEVLKGHFQDDQQHGYGVHIWNDLGLYAGNWENGEAIGRAVRVLPDGTIYAGTMESFSLQGTGLQSWADSSLYRGDFVNGTRQGQGTQVYTNNAAYTGQWEQDDPKGIGTVVLDDGSIRSGYMEDFTLDGKGLHTWKSGTIYYGDFVQGKRTGQGTIIWPDGSIYTGEFADDQQNGYGIYINAQGEISQGYWINGVLQPQEAAE